MTAKIRSECYVFAYLPGEVAAVPAGLLTITQNGRDVSSSFVYGNHYRVRPNAISLDPDELPLTLKPSEVLHPKNGNVLFGCLRDAAPDAWGRLVINDKWAHKHKKDGYIQPPNTFDLPEMEYLLRSRNDRVGVIDFREDHSTAEPSKRVSGITHLNELVREASRISRHEPAKVDVVTLLHPGTGMGGARPKTSIEDEDGLWLAKFPMDSDRLPITRIEQSMLLLAKECGIDTVESRLLDMDLGEPVFMIKRFDREISNPAVKAKDRIYTRTMYLSALTAMGKDEFNQSSSSYQEIAKYLWRNESAKDQSAARKQVFKRMVFNILVNNDDDHMRNHGFLRNGDGTFRQAPVFDIVPRLIAPGMSTARRQAIGVGMMGREGTIDNILSDVSSFDMHCSQAAEVLKEVATMVRDRWEAVMIQCQIPEDTIRAFDGIMAMAGSVVTEMDERDSCHHRERV